MGCNLRPMNIDIKISPYPVKVMTFQVEVPPNSAVNVQLFWKI